MSKLINGTNYLSYEEVSKRLGIAKYTVANWVHRGKLHNIALPGTGNKYIPEYEVNAYLVGNNPINETSVEKDIHEDNIENYSNEEVSTALDTVTNTEDVTLHELLTIGDKLANIGEKIARSVSDVITEKYLIICDKHLSFKTLTQADLMGYAIKSNPELAVKSMTRGIATMLRNDGIDIPVEDENKIEAFTLQHMPTLLDAVTKAENTPVKLAV